MPIIFADLVQHGGHDHGHEDQVEEFNFSAHFTFLLVLLYPFQL